MKESGNFLKLEVVWKDEYMLELEVTVSNNGFSAVAYGYDTAECLEKLAKELKGFPKFDRSISYKMENSGGGSFTKWHSIRFTPIIDSGLAGVKVDLEHDGAIDCQNSTVSVELVAEPNSVDIFKTCLTALASSQTGSAKMVGK